MTTLADSLREMADRVGELEASVIDFGDEMLRATMADEVRMVLDASIPGGPFYGISLSVTDAVLRFLRELAADDGTPKPRKRVEPDWNDSRITSGRGDGKP